MPTIITLLKANATLFSYVKDYLGIIILFSTCYMVGYALEIYIKVDGNPIYPTICVITGGVINIILDYFFVVVFDFGIKGAAIATGISQVTSTTMLFYYIFFRAQKIKFVKVKYSILLFFKVIKTGFAEFLAEATIGVTIWFFNTTISELLKDIGILAFGIICYVTSFVTMTMIGFNQGVQPLISFYYGAKNSQKIKSIIRISTLILTVIGIILYIVINCFTKQIIFIFSKTSEDINFVQNALKLYSFSYLICGFNIFIAGFFTAIDKVKISTFITLLRGIFLIKIFLFIFPNVLGISGIWLVVPATEIITLIFSLFFIKKVIT